MGYVSFRDNPAIAGLNDKEQEELIMLADSLEYEGQQSYHNDACGCDAGRLKLSSCLFKTGIGSSVYPDEIVAMLYARGDLKLNGETRK